MAGGQKGAHSIAMDALLQELGSSPHGLTDTQAASALLKYGPNEIKLQQSAAWPEILVRQFKNILILMLLASSAIAYLVKRDIFDAVGILAAVLLSVIFGFVQEYKAEQALEALRKMTAPHANVVREGKEKTIPASNLVPGDLILLAEGDMVPSDCRLVESSNLSCDQSSLTGESHPVPKSSGVAADNTPMAERSNIAFAGTTVVRGHCRAIVFATGLSTEFGKVASRLASVEDEPAPMQKNLNALGENIGKAAILLCIIFFVFGVMRGEDTAKMLIVAITLAVAAIPEGLPTVLAITMAIGVQRMAKRNAIVRRLPAVETLGSTTVICTDKTGTLTANRMALLRLHTQGKSFSIGGGPLETSGSLSVLAGGAERPPTDSEWKAAKFAILAGTLCNTAALFFKGAGRIENTRGDPTEVAILVAAEKIGVRADVVRGEQPKEAELAFEYSRKMMTQIRKRAGKLIAYTKGAPESVLLLCSHIETPKGRRKLASADRKLLKAQWESYANGALRTLAFAYREVGNGEMGRLSCERIEKGLTWIGVGGFIDPPRPEAKSAIAACQKAGIRVVMITGDSHQTAKEIASQLGILIGGYDVFDGDQIEKMGKAELCSAVKIMAVCARATPEHKFLIVNALKENGEIVAVTGDGVNDAPSIKSADIGIAMGLGGTDVARGASDIVLADNNFHTISLAISQGRSIYENVRSFVRFQFATNVAALSLMFAAPILGLPLPLKPLQILWINIIMDGPPAIGLGMEPGRQDAMERPPRSPSAPFVSRSLISSILTSGLLMFVMTFAVFWGYLQASGFEHASTMAFTLFVVLQLVNAFNCRSPFASALSKPFANKFLLGAVLISLLLHLGIIYLPFLQGMFGTVPLSVEDWYVMGVCAVALLVFEEARKKFLPKTTEY